MAVKRFKSTDNLCFYCKKFIIERREELISSDKTDDDNDERPRLKMFPCENFGSYQLMTKIFIKVGHFCNCTVIGLGTF